MPVLPSRVSCQKGERGVCETKVELKKSDIQQNSNEVTIEVYMAAFRNKRHHTALGKKLLFASKKTRICRF